jgi:dTDP-4-amino-4,6-dideoxygalactose transaminase
VNVLDWNQLHPVFCDICPETCNINPDLLEPLITLETRAIMPVHVYGTPCDVERIQQIADRHHLPVIYDAAHAFGVRYKGKSLLSWGTMSMLSFHATKIFTTAEGGALAMAQSTLYERVRLLKNFGIADEETVITPGINGKMNELQAALGLAQLESLNEHKEKRKEITALYRENLGKVPGIATLEIPPDVEHNYAYFPIRIKPDLFGIDRDCLHNLLKQFNIYCRKYFSPLCSTYSWCHADEGTLPESESAAREILCLPVYSALSKTWADNIVRIIKELGIIVCA